VSDRGSALLTNTFQFWSQLHLVPSFSAPGSATETYPANSSILNLNLEQDSDSDFDLSNVKPPNGISPVSFASVQVSLIFSQIPVPLKRSQNRSEEVSPSFEDLLGPQHNRQIPHLDLKIPDWQDDEYETFDDYEALLDHLPYRPVTLLCGIDDPLKHPRSLIRANSGSLCLPDPNFHSLEICNSVFSSQTSNVAYQVEEHMVLSGEYPSFQTNKMDPTPTSGSVSTFEFLKPETTGCFRSAGKRTVSSSSLPTIRKPPPAARHNLASYESILGLTDAALRTFIHLQPTRRSAGIKLSRTDPGSDPDSSEDEPRLTALSDLAPSIFTPGYAQAVVERAPLMPGIAKSLATFLRYGHRSGSDGACEAEPQGRSDEEEGKVQEDVKDMLRRRVWMTMTNGLRVSYSEKARRLRPLAMPRQWREHNGEEDMLIALEEEVEMLDEALVSRAPSPGHCRERAEKEILELLEGEVHCGIEDEFEEDLLLDDEEVDLSFLEEEFEELCLFGRDMDLDDIDEGEGMVAIQVGVGDGFADHMEEMLL
jgi:hypothetical protein